MATGGRTCTFKEAKDYLMSTLDSSKKGKIPNGAQQNVWMALMPPPTDHFNEVFPNIVLGDAHISRDPGELQKIGITHVVNCAHGTKFNQVDTSAEHFQESGIKFHGIRALDIMTFKMSPHFEAGAEFIHNALESGGKVYVHCISGVSRSASIVLAFLMLQRNTPLMDALKTIRGKRNVLPNDGFLRQLVELNDKLFSEPEKDSQSATEKEPVPEKD